MRLELRDVTKRFGEQVVLDRMSLTIAGEQVVVLLGASGCGKSTLLRILAGLIVPEEGTVNVEGETLPRDEAGLRRHRRKVGTVFQAFNLFPHLTAAENIALPLREVHGQTKEAATERTEALLRRFRLLDQGGKKPAALSGGQ
ncbi:MAG: ATP-binding cassette domain-containing protein [Verrucomicrobiia bacterium]